MNSGECGFNETKYSHFLSLCPNKNQQVSLPSIRDKQQNKSRNNYYIKNLHETGISYRRITKLLNKKSITTFTAKELYETGNSVYSVLKKYHLREESFELLNREYELDWELCKLI